MRVQFVSVGRPRREWRGKARDEESNTIAISGQRFDSLSDAMRDAREQIEGERGGPPTDDGPFDGPFAA